MEGKDKLPLTAHHAWAGVEPWPGEAAHNYHTLGAQSSTPYGT